MLLCRCSCEYWQIYWQHCLFLRSGEEVRLDREKILRALLMTELWDCDPLTFKWMNHPTLVHLYYTFSSYKYIFAYRLLLLFICFTVDNFIFINLKLLKKKKKKPSVKPKWSHTWQMLQMWPVLPAWSVCHLIKCLCDLLWSYVKNWLDPVNVCLRLCCAVFLIHTHPHTLWVVCLKWKCRLYLMHLLCTGLTSIFFEIHILEESDWFYCNSAAAVSNSPLGGDKPAVMAPVVAQDVAPMLSWETDQIIC